MFLTQLTPPQQDAFLQLAAQLIAIDGEIHPDEQEMLARLAIGAVDWVPQDVQSLPALLLVFDDHRSRVAMLLELIGLAYADTEYRQEERDFIADLARRTGISEARLAMMEAWVIRQLALSQEGLKLLEED